VGNNGKQTSVTIGSAHMQHTSMDLRSGMHINCWPKELECEGWSAESLCQRIKETVEHTLYVAEMTVMLARMAGIPESKITYVRYGALLHDIGKLGIPAAILLKPSSLSNAEWDIMRKHPIYAYDLLYPIEYLRPYLPIPFSHHEKWDGTGYPQGLKGEQIPLAARLFAVADVWDSLYSDRVFREAWSQEKVMDYIQKQSGSHFDPGVIEMFLYVINKMDNQSVEAVGAAISTRRKRFGR